MKDTLKILTCGSVDDGKSTLIGHMLYDSKMIFADQKKALELDSKVSSSNGEIDYSLLLDGLIAEREQKITIDVAYRYFSTNKRNFIIADTPGHVQYTRNMAVGASFADCAILLVDASKGLKEQTNKHYKICTLFGIKDFIFAINKMDLIGYSKNKFLVLEKSILKMCANDELNSINIIPVSATKGDNIIVNAKNLSWYKGKPLLKYLETLSIKKNLESNFCFPIQRVSRPNSNFRGYQGEVISGNIKLNDEIIIYPNKEKTRVNKIIENKKYIEKGYVGDQLTICLNDDIDISRGSIFSKNNDLIVNNKFIATILWMDDNPLLLNSNYLMKINTQEIPVTISKILNIAKSKSFNAQKLDKNSITLCEITCGINAIYLPFKESKKLGSFILIDRLTNSTSGCGTIEYPLNTHGKAIKQNYSITKLEREKLNNHKGITIWFTGLSCSGKSTIANLLERELYKNNVHTMVLDGDNVRLGLCHDLNFDINDRSENIRRLAEVAKLLNDAGVVCLVAAISPLIKDRLNAKKIIGKDNFFGVFVDTDIKECENRDKKGLYKKAKTGELKEFSGITSPYDKPKNPDFIIKNNKNNKINISDLLKASLKKLKN